MAKPRGGRIVLLSCAALAVALTGCTTGQTSTPTQSAQPTGSVAAAPIDALTWALSSGEPASLDWRKVFSGADLLVYSNVCESLMRQNIDGSLVPNLAESITQPTPTTYDVKLRTSVTFSDGSPVTNADVIYSLQQVTGPKASAYFSSFSRGVTAIAATATGITITLDKPNSLFLRMLATPMGAVQKQSAVVAGGKNYGGPDTPPVCTGPFKVKSWTAGQDIELLRNDSYWNTDLKPKAAAAKFVFLQDEATLSAALQTGGADGAYYLTGATYTRLASSGKGQTAAGSSTNFAALAVGTLNSGLMSDVRLRQSVSKAIDYDGIQKILYGGAGGPIRAMMPEGSWGYSKGVFSAAYDTLPLPSQNLEQATQLVKDAGATGKTVKIATWSSFPLYVKIANAVSDDLKRIGLVPEITSLNDAAYFDLYTTKLATSGYDLVVIDNLADVADPLSWYYQQATEGGSQNTNNYLNASVNAQLQQAITTIDDDARAKLVVGAQDKIVADMPLIPFAYVKFTSFQGNRITGAPTASTAYQYPWLTQVGAAP